MISLKSEPTVEFSTAHARMEAPAPSSLKRHGGENPSAESKRHKANSYKGNRKNKKWQQKKQQEPKPKDIRDVVTPLWRQPYTLQLKQKLQSVKERLEQYLSEAKYQSSSLAWPLAVGSLPCPLLGIVPAPASDFYRNKCEFTVGLDSTGLLTVGFNVGRFADGDRSVAAPDACLNIPRVTNALAAAFTEFVRRFSHTAYEKTDHSGFWRLLTVRTATSTGQVMLVVQVQSQTVTRVEIDTVKEALVQWAGSLSDLPDNHRIVSVCWQEYNGVCNAAPTDLEVVPLMGPNPPMISERLLGLNFSISPSSFFQTNSLGAERLYSVVKSFCLLSGNDIILDICCGTGTIGHILAAGQSVSVPFIPEDAFPSETAESNVQGDDDTKEAAVPIVTDSDASAVSVATDASASASASASSPFAASASATAAVSPSSHSIFSAASSIASLASRTLVASVEVVSAMATSLRVVGFELCEAAVVDARANALANGIASVEYRCGKAEDTLPAFLKSLPPPPPPPVVVVVSAPAAASTTVAEVTTVTTDATGGEVSALGATSATAAATATSATAADATTASTASTASTATAPALVAVVDPPRAGLHPSVLKALRRCARLDRLVYVSCNPATLVDDLHKLTAAASAKFPETPFMLEKAIAVDMFPHTDHCEMVVTLRRRGK